MSAERGTRFGQACRWGALLLVSIGYSVLAHRSAVIATPDALGAVVAILPMTGLAFVMAWRSSRRAVFLALWLAGCAGLYGASAWLASHYNWVFLLEHAGVNGLLGIGFGKSLQAGQTPLVTGFARLMHSTMSPALVRYTRAATWAWTVYFGTVTTISLLLFWLAPVAIWSTFVNLLGLPLLALMFAGEYAVRCFVLPVADRAGPLAAIHAYRQASSASGSPRKP